MSKNGAAKKSTSSWDAQRIDKLEQDVKELIWYHAGLSWFIQNLIAAQVAAQATPNVQAEMQKRIRDRLAQGYS